MTDVAADDPDPVRRLGSAGEAFLREFSPYAGFKAHEFLFTNSLAVSPDFRPDAEHTRRCVDAFRRLLVQAVQDQPLYAILALPFGCAELVIAYLERSRQLGAAPIDDPELRAVIHAHAPAFEHFVTSHSGAGNDAMKRLLTVASLLESPNSDDPGHGERPQAP